MKKIFDFTESRSTFWIKGLLRHFIKRLRKHNPKDVNYKLCAFPDDVIGREIAVSRTYEADGLAAVKWLSSVGVVRDAKSGVFLDIGANIGVYSIALAKEFGKILSYEPHPVIHQLLKINTHINKLENIEIFDFGLAKSDCEAELWEGDSENFGAASIVRNSGVGRHYKIKLRNACDAIEYATKMPIAFIKMDVEGYESEIIEGLGALLKKQLPVVAFEANDSNDNQIVIEQLRALGYVKFLALSRNPPLPFLWMRVLVLTIFGVRSRLKTVSNLKNAQYSLVFALSESAFADYINVVN